MESTWVRDAVILLARLGVGVIFIAHGLRKLAVDGIGATAESFAEAGVPLATLSAWLVALVELVAGIAMVIGLAVPVAGVLLAALMLGAYLLVHHGRGIFVDEGGAELVIALGAASLLLALTGAGRFGLDDTVGPAVRERMHLGERRHERVG